MDDLTEGFRIGERRFAWGTLPGEVAATLGLGWPAQPGPGWRRLETACGPSWGFRTIGVSMSARAPGRPVTALCYELAAEELEEPRPGPAIWMQPLMRALGTPRVAETTDVSAYPNPSDSVRFNADWSKGDHSVALSLYGAPRATAHGPAAGSIWLSWATVPAARPFLEAWRRAAAALAREAESHSGIVTFLLSMEPNPAEGEARDGATLARDSAYALGAPHLLPTPQPIADKLRERGIGFWRSGDHRRWYASTRWDTILFEIGAPVAIDWLDIAPAKGAGYSGIAMDGWTAYDVHASAAIKDAIAALETIPGVSVHHIDGYDC